MMIDKVTQIFDVCEPCHGHGYWLVDAMKKDGTPSKRAKRFPCPKCNGKGTLRHTDHTAPEITDDLPF